MTKNVFQLPAHLPAWVPFMSPCCGFFCWGLIHFFMSLRSVSIFKIRRKPPTFKTLFLFSEAMEAKHVVATTEEDGTVRLATNDKSVTLQSPTLAALYAPEEGSNIEAQSTQPKTEGMVGNAAPSLLATEPWRGRALAAAEALVTQFDERSDINMEDWL